MPPQEEEILSFPPSHASLISPYLPQPTSPSPTTSSRPYPHVTLTYAHSLDASIALAPGVRTALSGPQSKAMTHFLRARHDAILVGAGTAVADDPGLNSRLEGVDGGRRRQPRPVVLDPRGRWDFLRGKVIRLAREGRGLGPWVMVASGADDGVTEERRRVLEEVGGRYLTVEARGQGGTFEWGDVLAALKREGVESVMIEGGGEVINSLLAPPGNRFVDSVIVTIAPTWLGQGGVVISPPRMAGEDGTAPAAVRLAEVTWCPLGEDVVLCGRIVR
ncbi:hypothetical protein VTK56DRAFT_2778 [Thermocarpiscus australiensis]